MDGLGGGSATNGSDFDSETNNGASRSDVICSFIAAYCDRKRFEPVGPLQCSRTALARVIALGSRRIVAACASKLGGRASARRQAVEDELLPKAPRART
jgi:hypothetical protein